MTKPLVVFGNASEDPAVLAAKYPGLHFISLKQIHSDRVVNADDALATVDKIEADALWYDRAGAALCIRTADCLPVLFFAPRAEPDDTLSTEGITDSLIAAAHAGWRGVASNIVGKTIEALRAQGADISQMQAWIGPHIKIESFEVGLEVVEQLEKIYKALPSQGEIVAAHKDPQKRYVNLERIVIAQLAAAGVPLTQIQSANADTFKDRDYHSYRRDAGTAGRQISFIALR